MNVATLMMQNPAQLRSLLFDESSAEFEVSTDKSG